MDSTDNFMKTKKEVYAALHPSNNLMKISARHFCFLSKALLRLPVLIYPIIIIFFSRTISRIFCFPGKFTSGLELTELTQQTKALQ